MVKVIGVIRPQDTQEIAAEAVTYEDAKRAVDALVPEGFDLLLYRRVDGD